MIECGICNLKFNDIRKHISDVHVLTHEDGQACGWKGCKNGGIGGGDVYTEHIVSHIRKRYIECTKVLPDGSICGKFYQNRNSYNGHVLFSHSNKDDRLKCITCHRVFRSIKESTEHAEIHINRKFICGFILPDGKKCGSRFFNRKACDKHMSLHNGSSKEYVCDCVLPDGSICQQKFKYGASLAYHKKKHLDLYLVCNFILPDGTKCKFKSITKQNIEYHRETHTKDRPYKCHFKDKDGVRCTKTFSLEMLYNDHYNMHTGRKPYKCIEETNDGNKCDMSFHSKNCLSSHIRKLHRNN